ncbi:hypothetical protein EXIGLDRAFT_174614 [Exidia glandulosa HHB12029]|uniref:Uncharacterized protein n=1 Tax=Exidia glandulosa HHB12029 TaxID=1314781 RepID=A0A165F7F3_EXIGL|nr:hypothetical protein EXIGLDRAFT_174614 [Exidia glandulosa HHB12029]
MCSLHSRRCIVLFRPCCALVHSGRSRATVSSTCAPIHLVLHEHNKDLTRLYFFQCNFGNPFSSGCPATSLRVKIVDANPSHAVHDPAMLLFPMLPACWN